MTCVVPECPECGEYCVEAQEWMVQEIDPETMRFHPSETLIELVCQGCGWYAASRSPAL